MTKRLLTVVGVTASRQPPARPERADRRLLDAAVAAFSARGFHGTTTRDVAAAAGMSPAAVYVHFRSKEELLWAISIEGHRRTLEVVDAALAAAETAHPGDPVARLGRLVEDFVGFHARAHTTVRVLNYELPALEPAHRAEVEALRRAITERVVAVLEDGVAAGVLRTDDVRMTAAALLSLGIDVARWYDDDRGWSADDLAVHYRRLVLAMVGAS